MSRQTDLIDAALAAMRRLGTEVDALDRRAADHFGIGRTDLHVIEALRAAGPLTASELARSVGLTRGGLSIALDRLERIGYVRRYQHPEDRRSVLVEATDTVAPVEAEVFGALIDRMRVVLAEYDAKQLVTIEHFLDRAATTIRESDPDAEGPTGSY
jgi:DNA-binding MarR family transcriptional regulator